MVGTSSEEAPVGAMGVLLHIRHVLSPLPSLHVSSKVLPQNILNLHKLLVNN